MSQPSEYPVHTWLVCRMGTVSTRKWLDVMAGAWHLHIDWKHHLMTDGATCTAKLCLVYNAMNFATNS